MSKIVCAIFFDKIGGTALPICLNAEDREDSK